MYFAETFLAHYGWEGAALAALLLVTWGIQLRYRTLLCGRVASYRDNRRPEIRTEDPGVSVIIPMFSEDYAFVEERLPLILAQEYPDFEVVLVYVGCDGDFYEDLQRLRLTFPQIFVTHILLNPRFPISRKMALNVGIKLAHHECLLFTSTEALPASDRWLALMARGFRRGEVVLGYCGLERQRGAGNLLMRTWRLMHSADWLARAVRRRPYRGTLHNMGFTKSVYFGARGFNRLNMNIGEDDLFLQQVMTRDNVSVILSPRATLRERAWGGFGRWLDSERYNGSTERFYPAPVRAFTGWERVTHLLFLLATLCAVAIMPPEFGAAALLLAAVRYLVAALGVRRLARRLGETGIAGRYLLYDLAAPLLELVRGAVLLRCDRRVWRG